MDGGKVFNILWVPSRGSFGGNPSTVEVIHG